MIKNSKILYQNAYKNFQKCKQNYKNESLRKEVKTERARNPIINKKVPIKEKIAGNEKNKIFKDVFLKKEDLKEELPIEECLKEGFYKKKDLIEVNFNRQQLNKDILIKQSPKDKEENEDHINAPIKEEKSY